MNFFGKPGSPQHLSRWLTALILTAVGCCLLFWRAWQSSPQQTVARAQELLSDGKPAAALSELAPLLKRFPPNGDASFCAGQACTRLHQWKVASLHFLKVPADHPLRAEACFRAGDLYLLKLLQLSAAERSLTESLSLNPNGAFAKGHLAALAGLCGFTTRAARLRLERLQAGEPSEHELLLLALSDTAAEEALSLADFVRVNPHDPLVRLAQGYQAWQHHQWVAARSFYESAITERPDLEEAQARFGRILCELDDEAAFLQWHQKLTSAAGALAETWAVRGDWAIRHGDTPGAIRCYWEAARRDPMHRRAHHQLGSALTAIREPSIAAPFQFRHEQLQRSLIAAKQCAGNPTCEAMLRCLAMCREGEQPWETWGWATIIRRRFPDAAQELSDAQQRPQAGLPRVLPAIQPALQVDLSRFPLPVWADAKPLPTAPLTSPPPRSNPGSIHFRDDAAQSGLHFRYVNGDTTQGPGMRTFQFTGGGVGVLDYDRDGWPDLYFTQGGHWPIEEANPPTDLLFRNQRGESFDEVSAAAGIREIDYSQGLAIGDVDADGWDDLFVANVAGNRLFHNNGDGTFRDITDDSGINDNEWSTSAVCADFNSDGLPDLYVVNYLTGPDLASRICHRSDGRPRGCTPHELEAADDQLLLNLGDGRFQDISQQAGILAPGGKGLGVVAADFDNSGRLSLFVSNDTTANFFFQNQPPAQSRVPASGDIPRDLPGGTFPNDALPRFQENAIVAGLAFDFEGRSQACMGIAAGDANGDGMLDLFVTNYFDEYNALYLRQEDTLFLDSILNSGLRDAGLKQLGFGTQFLDADLDGWPDLVVTNGHVDDETDRGIPLHMPTQVFHGTGEGRFAEVTASELGPWFAGNYLGRGLARLDWNRDGKEDFVVSNLDSPAALLTNVSERCGGFLALELVGTNSARVPIGATVRLQSANGRSQTQQLTAGDGYQASNQKQLVFGVGAAQQVDIRIRWPSGLTETFSNMDTSQAWLLIEGRGPYRMP